MLNDFYISLTGGFALIFLLFTVIFGGLFIYIHIVGGSMSYETKGLIPQLKEYFKKKGE